VVSGQPNREKRKQGSERGHDGYSIYEPTVPASSPYLRRSSQPRIGFSLHAAAVRALRDREVFLHCSLAQDTMNARSELGRGHWRPSIRRRRDHATPCLLPPHSRLHCWLNGETEADVTPLHCVDFKVRQRHRPPSLSLDQLIPFMVGQVGRRIVPLGDGSQPVTSLAVSSSPSLVTET
jgi:hypothetical protein